jgi:hypothetical protein
MGLVVEVVNTAKNFDLLRRKGSTRKLDKSRPMDFPFKKNLDP